MIYGYLKAAGKAICGTKSRVREQMLQSINYTSSVINQHVRSPTPFITFDRDIVRNADGQGLFVQRPLRAETAKGPRVTLARSSTVPEGAKLAFTLRVLNGSPLTQVILEQLLSYGVFTGLGQWRNSGRGKG